MSKTLFQATRSRLRGLISSARGLPARCVETPHLGDPVRNETLACSEYRAGKTEVQSLPTVVTYALTTYCFTKDICLICDRNLRDPKSDTSATEAAIDAVTPLLRTARTVYLHCGGEAMYSPQFDRVISLIGEPTKVAFATNGMALTPRRSELMLERDIMDGFVVSLDAATPEMMRIMRPACDFELISKNVAYYNRRARELERDTARIILNMTICQTNVEDVPGLVDLAERLGALRVEYNHLNGEQSHTVKTVDGRDWVYSEQAKFQDPARHDELVLEAFRRAKKKGILFSFVGHPFIGPRRESIDRSIVDEIRGSVIAAPRTAAGDTWQSPAHKPLSPELPFCAKPWREVIIQPTGVVRGCYFHDEVQHNIGNIVETDFMEIWNSREMVRRREQFLGGGVSKVCLASHPCMYRGRQ